MDLYSFTFSSLFDMSTLIAPLLRTSRRVVLGKVTQFRLPRTIHTSATLLSKPTLHTKQSNAQTITSSNPPLSFPCLDANIIRESSLDGGPEPAYDKIVTGYDVFHHPDPFLLDHGGILPEFQIAFETWGKLNADKSNAILIHTGLSGSSHAKSHSKNVSPGWWENFIGPGAYIDTDKFFVICTNVLGGCYGSTGPSSTDPADGDRYATRFPILTVMDMVRAQFLLLDSLGIKRLHASVGASMGGMQSLAAGVLAPERIGRVVSISACARSHPYSIAMRHTQRQVLMSDPHWNRGFYYHGVPPHVGMKLAREIATISYRSGPEWEKRFGRKRAQPDGSPALCPDFLIETYLDHQGERFCLQYDPNSLLYVSKAMDLFELGASSLRSISKRRDANQERLQEIIATRSTETSAGEACRIINGSSLNMYAIEPENALGKDYIDPIRDLVEGMAPITMPTLVIGVQSDILFPVWQQKEIAECLRQAGNKQVTYYELDSIYGHDTFLIDRVSVGGAVKGHLELVE